MKLRLLVFAAFCPILASAQSIFDFINPFYWIFNLILDAMVPENAICGIIEIALEGVVGQGDIIQCSCNNVFNVLFFFPLGITSGAACSTTASLDLNNLPVTAFEFDVKVTAGFVDVISLVTTGIPPFLTVNDLDGCVTVDGKKICADYSGSIRLSGIEINTCEINVNTQDCDCQICGDKESVKFDCTTAYPLLNTSGKCVSPLLVDF